MNPRTSVLPDSLIDSARASASSSERNAANVDIWYGHLDVGLERLEDLSSCLNSEERARAARYHFDVHRTRFMSARGFLRNLLAHYLDKSPDLVRFSYDPHGKPVLIDDRDLHFNVSHSDDLLAIGIAANRPVGIDIEPVQPGHIVDSLSSLVFCEREQNALQGLCPVDRCESFARFWTRKEAYIKADGRGMTIQLDHIDVSTIPGRVLVMDGSRDRWSECPDDWTLQSLPVAEGLACAVASQGSWQYVCYDLSSDW